MSHIDAERCRSLLVSDGDKAQVLSMLLFTVTSRPRIVADIAYPPPKNGLAQTRLGAIKALDIKSLQNT